MRLDQQPRSGRRLLDVERVLRHRRERFPALGRHQAVAERQQRLQRALALAVQQAAERQQVFHPEARAGLTEARGALVAQQHHQAFGLRVGRERFELRAGF